MSTPDFNISEADKAELLSKLDKMEKARLRLPTRSYWPKVTTGWAGASW